MDQTAWDERYAGPELVWGSGPNCFVAEELATLPPGRAIDPGTGEGRNAIWLAERGFTVTAVDFSRVGLARAAGLAGARGGLPPHRGGLPPGRAGPGGRAGGRPRGQRGLGPRRPARLPARSGRLRP